MNVWDAALALWAKDCGVAVPVKEYRFAPPRRWRFDYCWPDQKVALEVNGGAWVSGRHTRAVGYGKDLEKLNAAQLAGWIVLQFTPQQLKTSVVADGLRDAFRRKAG